MKASNDLFLFHLRPELCNGKVLNSLSEIRIGVGRDYDYSDEFIVQYGHSLKPVDRIQQNLLKLQLGRVDMVLEDKRIIDYTIEHGPKEISGLAPLVCPNSPLLTLPLFFGINKDYPNADVIISAFNAQLKGMKKDGTLDTILKKLGRTEMKIAGGQH